MEENTQLQMYHQIKTSSPYGLLWTLIGGALAVVALIAGLIAAWGTFVNGAHVVVTILIVIACVAIPAAVIGALFYAVRHARRKERLEDMHIDALEAEEKRRKEAHEVEMELKRRHIPFDNHGNAAVLNPYSGVVQYIGGNMPAFPDGLTSLSYHNAPRVTGVAPENAPALPEANLSKPTIEEISSKVQRNSYQVSLGRSTTDPTNYLIAEINEAHLKIIGGTRQGKSCEAGAIMQQIQETHDPARLTLALLDLEYKTSRLFEGSAHLAEIDVPRKGPTICHAKSLDEVPIYLHYLAQVLDVRYRLSDWDLEKLPHILIYFEEFLDTTKRLKVKGGKLYTQYLTDFNTIATRGLKIGLHLMVCAQVDYANDDLKDAMNQFLGVNIAFGVRPQAAMAAGFVNSELLAQNYANRKPGNFVVEMIGGADLGIAPDFDVKAKLKQLDSAKRAAQPSETSQNSAFRTGSVVVSEVPGNEIETSVETGSRNEQETALQAKLKAYMDYMAAHPSASATEVIYALWGVRPGRSVAYEQARDEYGQIYKMATELARQAWLSNR